MKTVILAIIIFLSTTVNADAQSFTAINQRIEQGDVLIIRIAPQWQGPQVSIAVFGKNYLPNNQGEVFIGVDKNMAPGKHIVTLVEYGKGTRLSQDYAEIEVVPVNFRIRKRTPGKPRDPYEVEKIVEAYASGNSWEKYIDSPFVHPIDRIGELGTVTSPFGEESHRGVDLKTLDRRTKEYKRPVRATNSGIVVLTAINFSLEGNMIILDHGSGIFSLYMHLDKIQVLEGQPIGAGQVIGVSGMTGNATKGGPHLHFAIRIGDPNDNQKFTVVDPLKFIATMNEYIKNTP